MTRKVVFLIGLCALFMAPAAHADALAEAVQRRRAERLAALEEPNISIKQPTIILRTQRTQETEDISAIFNRADLRRVQRPSLRELRRNARLQQTESRGTRGTSSVSLPTGNTAELKKEVLDRTNAERATAGLTSYTYNRKLENSAQQYAEELWEKGFFSHTGLDDSTPKDRIAAAGYGDLTQENCGCRGYRVYFGENLAKGQDTPEQAVRDWMNSPSHRDAILHEHFTEIGIGIAGNVWVQNFGAIEIDS